MESSEGSNSSTSSASGASSSSKGASSSAKATTADKTSASSQKTSSAQKPAASSSSKHTGSSANTAAPAPKPESKPEAKPESKPQTPPAPAPTSAPTAATPAPTAVPAPTATPHVHNYTTTVSTTPGSCTASQQTVVQCSCGATNTITGAYGDHAWQTQTEEIYHEPVTEQKPIWKGWCECLTCGARFDSNIDAARHGIVSETCSGAYTAKEEIVGYETVVVQEGWTETITKQVCTTCGATQ